NKGTTTETKNSSTDQSSGTRNASGKQGGAAAGNAAASGQSSSATSAETTAESDTIADIEMVNAFVLNSNSQMLVTVSVDEADIGSVQEGQSAQVTITALPEETFQGEISGISNVSSSSGSSVKYEVEITIDKADDMLNGMSASATIYIDQAENVVTIPSAAVQEKGGKAYVYTQKDSDGNLSGETEVTTGLSDGNQVEIKEGLSEGDTVYYEIYSSNNSENSSKEMNFDKMGDFGGNHNGGNGGPGNPPSGSPDRSN
ncbi:MAG: HlyD family efflux transporter periplasmic adaptor subunit, partial [Eubacterium sp.]|nr:HlyD family efflux transporter periplasmic adaptor subunit [Eubacterium sp.]